MQAVVIQINYPILESLAFEVPQPRGADYGTVGPKSPRVERGRFCLPGDSPFERGLGVC